MKQRSIPRGSVEYIEAVIETADDPASATMGVGERMVAFQRAA